MTTAVKGSLRDDVQIRLNALSDTYKPYETALYHLKAVLEKLIGRAVSFSPNPYTVICRRYQIAGKWDEGWLDCSEFWLLERAISGTVQEFSIEESSACILLAPIREPDPRNTHQTRPVQYRVQFDSLVGLEVEEDQD